MPENPSNAFHKGQTVWVPHEAVGYTKGLILEVLDTNQVTVELQEFESNVEIAQTSLFSVDVDKKTMLATEDLTKLPDLHRPALLEALRQRFLKNSIYTYTGHILIAINPFKPVPSLYGGNMMKKISTSVTPIPHIYSIANDSFRAMTQNKGLNQSILVSGESGSGKTVSVKFVLDFLTSHSGSQSTISQIVLDSNPILESFGNARTLRNNNSSRFGKLIELQFIGAKLDGCTIETYLLEKARILQHNKGERSFHIFYQLAAGLSESQKAKIELPDVEECVLTNAHNGYVLDDTDAEEWLKTHKAFKTIGLNDEDIWNITKLVSAILHLGEMRFKESGDGVSVSDLEVLASLLEVDILSLKTAFLERTIKIMKQTVTKLHTVNECYEARNALMISLYERLFLWLVFRINAHSKDGPKTRKKKKTGGSAKSLAYHECINLLDIFGFEVFEKNGFEQCLINYANEQLQHLFNDFIFKTEQNIYKAEGIRWAHIVFPDNMSILSVIEDPKVGLLKLIDDECLSKGNDKLLHDKIYKLLAKKYDALTINENTQKHHSLFTIKHFAGDVEYLTTNFCSKNKNEIRAEQIGCIRSSKNDLIKILLPQDPAEASGSASVAYFERMGQRDQKAKESHGKLQQSTVGNNFRVELENAIQKIKKSELHFVRCIKPNDLNEEEEFDRKRVLEQLNYSGVLEAIKISRLGYASRFLFIDFVQRFFVLLNGYKRIESTKNLSFKNYALDLIELNGLTNVEDYQIGKTKVFLKPDAFTTLENKKRMKVYKFVVILQRNTRSFLFRMKILKRIQRKRKAQKVTTQIVATTPPKLPKRVSRNVQKVAVAESTVSAAFTEQQVYKIAKNPIFDDGDDSLSTESDNGEVDYSSTPIGQFLKSLNLRFEEEIETYFLTGVSILVGSMLLSMMSLRLLINLIGAALFVAVVAMLIVEVKIMSDRKRKNNLYRTSKGSKAASRRQSRETYRTEVNRRSVKSNKHKKTNRMKRSKSKTSMRSKQSKKSKKTQNVNFDFGKRKTNASKTTTVTPAEDHLRGLSTAERIGHQKSARTSIRSLKSNKSKSKKFGGLTLRRSQVIEAKPMKRKKSKYDGLAYNFPKN